MGTVTVLLGLLVIGGLLFLIGWVRTPQVTEQREVIMQPVMFDHRHHHVDDAISCRYCHWSAFSAQSAGYPPTSLCMNCHNQIWNGAEALETVRQSYFTQTPIRWRRVHNLPEHVHFSHARHVNRGVGCVSCHGRVEQMAAVYQVEPLNMGWCLECHRNPAKYVRPQQFITDSAYTPARPQQVVGAEIVRERGINPPVNCSACHY